MRNIFVFAIGLFSGACYPHQDAQLAIMPDGIISGVPQKFGKAKLQLVFRRTEKSTDIASASITLGKHKTRLPTCITSLLETDRVQDVFVSGSWYHNENNYPHYLGLRFFDSGNKELDGPRNYYSLLFNLRSGKLIKLERQVIEKNNKTASGKSIVNTVINVNTICPKAETIKFFDPPRG